MGVPERFGELITRRVRSLPPLAKGALLFWSILAVAFVVVSSEGVGDIPLWAVILITAPYLALMIGVVFYTTWVQFRSFGKVLRPSSADDEPAEGDPEAQYRAELISHPEMMKRLGARGLEDQQGCSVVVITTLLATILLVGLFPRNADNSIKAEYVTTAFALLGTGSLFLLWRGIRRRPLRWACWTFVGLSGVFVPVGLLVLAYR